MDPEALLASTDVLVRRGPYTLASWQPNQLSAVMTGLLRSQETHAFVITDEMEVTAFLAANRLRDFPPTLRREDGWCLLTLDTVMEWDVVGVLAAVSSALARAGIPMGAVTAFSRDHLIVSSAHIEDAQRTLAVLCKGVSVVD